MYSLDVPLLLRGHCGRSDCFWLQETYSNTQHKTSVCENKYEKSRQIKRNRDFKVCWLIPGGAPCCPLWWVSGVRRQYRGISGRSMNLNTLNTNIRTPSLRILYSRSLKTVTSCSRVVELIKMLVTSIEARTALRR